MSDPCLTEDCIEKPALQRYNFFKLLILALLVLALLLTFVFNQRDATLVVDGPAPDLPTIALADLQADVPTLDSFAVDTAQPGLVSGLLKWQGSGTPGKIIELWQNDTRLAETLITDDGRWAFEQRISLAPGNYELFARQVEADGTLLAESDRQSVQFPALDDPGMVAAPTINLLNLNADNTLTADAAQLTGTGSPETSIQILLNDRVVGTTQTDANGNWRFALPFNEPGDYQLKAKAFDATGAVLAESDAQAFSWVEPKPMPAGEVVAPDMVSLRHESFEDWVILAGTGTPNATLQIQSNEQVVGNTQVDRNGNWSYILQLSEPGQYALDAIAVNADGSLIPSPGPILLTRAAALQTPTLTPAQTETIAETVLITGTGTPNALVQLLVDDLVVDTTEIDEAGNWSFEAPLPNVGDYTFVARSFQPYGLTATRSEPVIVSRVLAEVTPAFQLVDVVDPATLDKSDLSLRGTSTAQTDIRVLLDGDEIGLTRTNALGNWELDLQISELGRHELVAEAFVEGAIAATSPPVLITRVPPIKAPALAVATYSLVDDIALLSGTGTPNTRLQIQANGQVVDTVQIDRNGNWSYQLRLPTPGTYAVDAVAINYDGTLLDSPGPMVVERPPALVTPTLGADQPETDASQVILSGTGTPNGRLNLRVNGRSIDETTIDEDGNWTYQLNLPEVGQYQIQVEGSRADDFAIRRSEIIVIERLPSSPELTIPTITDLNVDADGETTTDVLEISGTATPETTVRPVVDGRPGSVIAVDETGSWSTQIDLPTVATYQLQIQALTAEGDVFAETEPTTITRIQAVEAPTLSLLNLDSNNETTAQTLTASGTGTPGSTVQLRIDDVAIATTTVDSDSQWTLPLPLPDFKTYAIQAEALDKAGDIVGISDIALVSRVEASEATEVQTDLSIFFPAANADVLAGQLTILGNGAVGQEVELLEDGVVVGQATVDENGEWRVPVTAEAGLRVYAARLVDRPETTASGIQIRFVPIGDDNYNCDLNAGLNRGDTYIVGTCDTFGTIIEALELDLDTLISANPQIENPDLIYPGDTLNLP